MSICEFLNSIFSVLGCVLEPFEMIKLYNLYFKNKPVNEKRVIQSYTGVAGAKK